ncbi:hypothetical protein [Endozoicomonas sp.]|uniref:hypothetical protein n=1 Tax=Endozoicomonas sp. TaxID=1892382 RepID=UPI00383A5710
MGVEIASNQTGSGVKANDYSMHQKQQGAGSSQYPSALNAVQSRKHKGGKLWDENKDVIKYIKNTQEEASGYLQSYFPERFSGSLLRQNITMPLSIDRRLQPFAIDPHSEQKELAGETSVEIKSRMIQSEEDEYDASGTEDKSQQTSGRAKRSNILGDIAGLEAETTVSAITAPVMTSPVSATGFHLQSWLDVLDEYVGKTALAEVNKVLSYYQSVRPEDDISGLLAKVDETLAFYQALNLIELTYFYAEAIKDNNPDTAQQYKESIKELSNALHEIIRTNKEPEGRQKRAPRVEVSFQDLLKNNLKKIDAISKTDAGSIQEFFRGFNERKCQIIYQAKYPLGGQAELKKFLNIEADGVIDRLSRLNSFISTQDYFKAGAASYDFSAALETKRQCVFVAEKDVNDLDLSRDDISVYLLEDSRKLFNIGEQLRNSFFSSQLSKSISFSMSRTNPVLYHNYLIPGLNPGTCSAYVHLSMAARSSELLLSNLIKSTYGLGVESETLLKLMEALQLFRRTIPPSAVNYRSELSARSLRLQSAGYKVDSYFCKEAESAVKRVDLINNTPFVAVLPDYLGEELVKMLRQKQAQARGVGQVSLKAIYELPRHVISIDLRINTQGEMIATWANTSGMYCEIKANSDAELVDAFNEQILPMVKSEQTKGLDRINKTPGSSDAYKALFNDHGNRVLLHIPTDSQIEPLEQLQILPNSCLTISDMVNHDVSLFSQIEQVRTTAFINDYLEFMQRPEVLKCLARNVPAGFQPIAGKVSVNDHVLLQMKEVRAAVENTLASGDRGARVPADISLLHNNLTPILEVIQPVIRGNKALANPKTLDNIAAGLGVSAGAAAPPVVWGPRRMPFSGELSEPQILNVGQVLALAQGADVTEMVDLVRQLPKVESVRQFPGRQKPALQSEESVSLNREKISNPESRAGQVKSGTIGSIASTFSWKSVVNAFKRPQSTQVNHAESFENAMRGTRQLNKNLGEQIGSRLAKNEIKSEAVNEAEIKAVGEAEIEAVGEAEIKAAGEAEIKAVDEAVIKAADEAKSGKAAEKVAATEEKELELTKDKKAKRKGIRKRTRKARRKESEQAVLCEARRKKRSLDGKCPPKVEEDEVYEVEVNKVESKAKSKVETAKVDEEVAVAEENMAGDTVADTAGQTGLEELGLDGAFTEGLGKESLELLADEGLAVLPEQVVLETAVGELAAGAMASGIGIAVGGLILIIQERELITDLLTDPNKFIDDIYAITLGLEAAGKEIRDNARAHHQRYHQLNGDTHKRYTIGELQYIAGGMTAEWFANGLDDSLGKMEKFAEDSYVDPRWQLHGRRRRSLAATSQSGDASGAARVAAPPPIEVHLFNQHNSEIKKARIQPELLKRLFQGKPSYTLHFVDRRPCHNNISPTPGVSGSDTEPRFPIQQPVSELVYQLMMQMRDQFNAGWLRYLESVSVANPWISEPEDVVDDYVTVQQFFWSDVKLQAELRKAGFRCDARELTATQVQLLAGVVGEQVEQAANHFARKAQQINDSIMRTMRTSQQQLQDYGVDPSGHHANAVDGPQRMLLQRAMDQVTGRVLLGLTDYLQQNNMARRAYKAEAEASVAMMGGIDTRPEAGTATRVTGGNATQPALLEVENGQPVISATVLKQLKRIQERAALSILEPWHQEKQQQLKDDLLTLLVDAVGTAGQAYSGFSQDIIRLPPDNPADTEPEVVAGASHGHDGQLPDLTRYQYAVDGFTDIYPQKQARLATMQQVRGNLKKQVQEKIAGLLARIKGDLSAIRGGREPHGDRRGLVNGYYRKNLDWARQQRAGFIDGVDRLFQDLAARLDKLAPAILPLTEAIPWPATADLATVERVLNGYMGVIRKDLSDGINHYIESLEFGDSGMVEGVNIYPWNHFWTYLTDKMATKVAALQSDGVISRSRLGAVLSIYQQTALEAYNFYGYQAMELSRKAVKSLQNQYRKVVNYPAEVSREFGEYLERQEKYHWLDQGGPGSATNKPYEIYGQVVRDQESGEWAREEAQREKEDSNFFNLLKGRGQVNISEQWIKDKITHIYYRYAQQIDQQVQAKSLIREQVLQEKALAQSLGLDISAVSGAESAGHEPPANPAAVFFEDELAVWRDQVNTGFRNELYGLVDYSLTTAYQDFLNGYHNRELGNNGLRTELEDNPEALFYAPLDKQRMLASHRAEESMIRAQESLTEQLHELQVSFISQGQHSRNDIRAVIDHEKAWASRQLMLLSAHGMAQLFRDWKTNVLAIYSESEGLNPPITSFAEYLALLTPEPTTQPGPQQPYRIDDHDEVIIPIVPDRPAHLQPNRHRRSLAGTDHSAGGRDPMVAAFDLPAATSGASRQRGILFDIRDFLGSMSQGILSATTGWGWASQSPAVSLQVPLIEPGATAGKPSSSAIHYTRHPGSPDSSSVLLVNYLVAKGTGLPVCENRECSPGGGNHSTLPGRKRMIGFTPLARPLYNDMVAYFQDVQNSSRAAADGWQGSDYLAMAVILWARERSGIPAGPDQKLVAGFIDQALRSPVVGTGHQRAGEIVARDERGNLRIRGVGLHYSDHLFYDRSRQLLVAQGNHRALGQCMMAATARQVLQTPSALADDPDSAAGPGDALAQQIRNLLPEISRRDLEIIHRAISLQGRSGSGSEATIRQLSRELKGMDANGGRQKFSAPKACRPVIRLLCQDKVNDARQLFIALSPGDQLAGIRVLAALPDLTGADGSEDLLAKVVGSMAGLKTRGRKLSPEQLNETWQLFTYLYDIKQAGVGELINESALVWHLEQRKSGNSAVENDALGQRIKSLLPSGQSIYTRCLTGFEESGHLLPVTAPYHRYDERRIAVLIRQHTSLEAAVRTHFSEFFGAVAPQLKAELVETISLDCLLDLKGKRKVAKQTITEVVISRLSRESAEFSTAGFDATT